jgi:hypothetical protein
MQAAVARFITLAADIVQLITQRQESLDVF